MEWNKIHSIVHIGEQNGTFFINHQMKRYTIGALSNLNHTFQILKPKT